MVDLIETISAVQDELILKACPYLAGTGTGQGS